MKALVSAVFVLSLLTSACGGSPTGPTTIPGPSAPGTSVVPQPQPTPPASALAIAPGVVTMGVGDSEIVFTGVGGKYGIYQFWMMPGSGITVRDISYNQVGLKMYQKPGTSFVMLNMEGYDLEGIERTVTARINVR